MTGRVFIRSRAYDPPKFPVAELRRVKRELAEHAREGSARVDGTASKMRAVAENGARGKRCDMAEAGVAGERGDARSNRPCEASGAAEHQGELAISQESTNAGTQPPEKQER